MADGMDLELQAAVVAALRASTALVALVGTAIYEAVPPNPDFPYVTIGETQEQDDSSDPCIPSASDIFLDVHIWSRPSPPSFVECKRIATAVRRAVHNQPLVLATHNLKLIQHRISRTFRDPDNVTAHGIVTFEALTEEVE